VPPIRNQDSGVTDHEPFVATGGEA
jgi:hypothetical protein